MKENARKIHCPKRRFAASVASEGDAVLPPPPKGVEGGPCRYFDETIHTVNCRDYTPEQIDAWAPLPPEAMDFSAWAESLARRTTFIAESDSGEVVGFGELEEGGHINRFYCHKSYQGVGVGTALLAAIEVTARQKDFPRLFTEASITAKPFFERRGFSALTQQSVERFGISLTNYRMEKQLPNILLADT